LNFIQTNRPRPVSSIPVSGCFVASSPKARANVPPYCLRAMRWCWLCAETVCKAFSDRNIESSRPEYGIRSQFTFASWPKNASTSNILQNWRSSFPFSLLKLDVWKPLMLPPASRIVPSLFSPKVSPKSVSWWTPEVVGGTDAKGIPCCIKFVCFFFFFLDQIRPGLLLPGSDLFFFSLFSPCSLGP